MSPTITQNDITGIVLAGGASRRMGSDKGLVLYNGRALVEYAIDALKPVCQQLVIITSNPAYRQFGLPIQGDIYPGCGPMGGLHAGMRWSQSAFYLLTPCDMPTINPSILKSLVRQMGQKHAVVLTVDGRPVPVCGIYSHSILSSLEQHLKEKRLKFVDFLQTFDHLLLDAKLAGIKQPISNINYPDQLI